MYLNNLSSWVKSAEGALRLDGSRSDAVHPDAVPSPLRAKTLHHRLHPGLGTCGRDDKATALIGVVGRDGQEDSTGLLGDHPLAHIKGQEACSLQHDVNDGLEGVGRQSLGGGDEVPCRVVDHHAWQAELSLYLIHGFSHSRGVSDVQLDGENDPVGLRGNLLGGLLQHWQSSAADCNLSVSSEVVTGLVIT